MLFVLMLALLIALSAALAITWGYIIWLCVQIFRAF